MRDKQKKRAGYIVNDVVFTSNPCYIQCEIHAIKQDTTCSKSRALAPRQPHPLLAIHQHTPALAAPSAVASNRRLEIRFRIVEDLVVKTARLQPHSRDARLFRLAQQRARYARRRNHRQRVARRRRIVKRAWRCYRCVLLVQDRDAGGARVQRCCGQRVLEVPCEY